MWAGACAGVVAGNDQSHRQFQCASFALLLGVGKHVSALHEWNLGFFQLSCYSHCFSNQLRGLIFLVLDHRPGVPNKWFKLLTPQGRSLLIPLSPFNTPPLLCPLQGAWVLTLSLLFPSYPTPCGSFFTFLVV